MDSHSMRIAVAILIGASLHATDWPRFRGPDGNGVSPDRGLPAEIGKDRNVLWSAKTPAGHSSPVVSDNRVFITGYEGEERVVIAYDAVTGAQIWRQSVKRGFSEQPNPLNGPTTPTPAIGGGSIFVFFPEFGLLAYDLEGRELWRVPLGPFGGVQGMAGSPVYAAAKVVLLIDTPEQATVTAYDAATGKVAWKKERPLGFLGSYTTPLLYEPAGAPAQIVVSGAVELTGYQVSTGERLWWARGVTVGPASSPVIRDGSVYTMEPTGDPAPPFSQMIAQYDKNKNGKIELTEVSGPSVDQKIMYRLFKSIDKLSGNGDEVLTEDEWARAFALTDSSGGLVRTKLGGRGELKPEWRTTKSMPYTTAPLLVDDVLYVVRNGGILATYNPETGKLLREARLKDAIGEYYAQPVYGDGKIYFVNKDGKVTVIKAGADWEAISTSDLEAQVIASPAIASSRIYIRTDGTLYCFAAAAAKN
jgi:outer membrane protein assembly factor BamB